MFPLWKPTRPKGFIGLFGSPFVPVVLIHLKRSKLICCQLFPILYGYLKDCLNQTFKTETVSLIKLLMNGLFSSFFLLSYGRFTDNWKQYSDVLFALLSGEDQISLGISLPEGTRIFFLGNCEMISNRIYTISFANSAVSWEVLMFWLLAYCGLKAKSVYATC